MTTRLAPLAGLATLIFSCAAVAGPVTPFEATFEFLRNDKAIGESRVALTLEDGAWTMTSATRGTRGLAKLLGLEESSLSRGDWQDGGPRPHHFEQTVEVSFKTIHTRAEFDWQAGTVHSVHEDGEDTLALTPGVLDPVSVGLAVRAGLGDGVSEWRLSLVDEDEIEEQLFEVATTEALDTPLGCLVTRRVDRIRGPESTRYTQTWYARDYDWTPVKVAHGKTDGDRMESRLLALAVNGESVEAGLTCP